MTLSLHKIQLFYKTKVNGIKVVLDLNHPHAYENVCYVTVVS